MRPRRVPLIRIGLTLFAGSILASLISFYIAVGASMADMHGETMSTESRDLLSHFTSNFLFAGKIPGIIFYSGLALMLFGVIRNFTRARSGGTTS
jgi:hypothetical protein